MTSSLHDPYESGYTCATLIIIQIEARTQVGANLEKLSSFGLFSETRKHEVGIASNHKSARYGECVLEPCTHRPSRSGSLPHL
jgi:hypothetical protein